MKVYDIIFSLGGSCAVASQLKARGLRLASYPFDWIFTKEHVSLERLADCFRNDFKDWMRIENLVDIDSSERNLHAAKYQYRDTYTGFRFIHDFISPKEDCLEKTRKKYMRRIERLYERLKKAKSVALCFDADYAGAREPLLGMRSMLLEKFGGEKWIDCYLVEFSADRYETIHEDNLTVFRFTHPKTDYVFEERSFEFMYMDEFQLSDMFKSEERGKGNRVYLVHTAHGIKCVLFKNKPRKFGFTISIGNRKYEFAWGGGVV